MKAAVLVLAVTLAFAGVASTANADPVEDALEPVTSPSPQNHEYECYDNPIPDEPDFCIIRG